MIRGGETARASYLQTAFWQNLNCTPLSSRLSSQRTSPWLPKQHLHSRAQLLPKSYSFCAMSNRPLSYSQALSPLTLFTGTMPCEIRFLRSWLSSLLLSVFPLYIVSILSATLCNWLHIVCDNLPRKLCLFCTRAGAARHDTQPQQPLSKELGFLPRSGNRIRPLPCAFWSQELGSGRRLVPANTGKRGVRAEAGWGGAAPSSSGLCAYDYFAGRFVGCPDNFFACKGLISW